MVTRSPATLLRITLAVLFLWVQGVGLSHAAVYGDSPHDHDGITCDVGVLVSDQHAILPDAPAQPYIPSTETFLPDTLIQDPVRLWPPERGPPPRSPPADHQ